MSPFINHVGQQDGHESSPVWRLLDELDRQISHRRHFIHTYSPRFDLEEIEDSYVLYGELPGVSQNNLHIIATDNHTLEISGKVERFPGEDLGLNTEDHPKKSKVSLKQDTAAQPMEVAHGKSENVVSKETDGRDGNAEKADKLALAPKRLLSERLLGEFHRSFSFPKPIESAGVAATMKNGILKVVVPKGPAPNERKVPVQWQDIFYAAF